MNAARASNPEMPRALVGCAATTASGYGTDNDDNDDNDCFFKCYFTLKTLLLFKFTQMCLKTIYQHQCERVHGCINLIPDLLKNLR